MEKVSKTYINFASVLDSKTREQNLMTSGMPFIYPHLASMPDAHLGLGAAVGSVIPTIGAIIPAAVGVDIGCGMIAVRTQFTHGDLRTLDRKTLRQAIERSIPLSAGNNNTSIVATAAPRIAQLSDEADRAGFDPASYVKKWALQLGTLGSGNHFIEVSVDENDDVWLFLHSGSRGVGNKIAQHHIRVALEQCRKRYIKLPHDDLAYLVEGDPEFQAYIDQLRWAQNFALLNREEMMDRVVACFAAWTGDAVREQERINCHHNYTAREHHYGKDVWLSRKGAIEASVGTAGLIPGSMGTASYIVEGLGFAPSLNSAPHGAGREYSRSAARKTFTHAQLRTAMSGIEYRDTDAFIDEIPAAYKDIDVVMADAVKMVRIRHTLRQIVNVKGD
ncbi:MULTISPECIES: RtcB family protein [unclassified Arthrobacter]|uniref:RtcB family protein n=1 Tax=unclassified Arthrobacter TaxID=235627 RepID=UPI0014916E8B|nr:MULTISPECIES: RtcB family protein [unclassified Arthrobacter]MBE0008531.1 RtcB family protein [Arthrobacter sp. AET 35A]NOJ62271.1 RtcB family protein [Arthrobacter sp. 147(2020)]